MRIWILLFGVSDLKDDNKFFFILSFFAYYFLKPHLLHFSKVKSQKEVTKSGNQGLSYYFCLMIEGSGSGRPKNIRILRIRIRSTASIFTSHLELDFAVSEKALSHLRPLQGGGHRGQRLDTRARDRLPSLLLGSSSPNKVIVKARFFQFLF
jgi:hypothetical protein